MGRTPRERAQAIPIQVGQDRVKPTPDVSAVKQMLGSQGAHQRVLHQVIGGLSVARQRARIAPQRWDGRLNALLETAHMPSFADTCVSRKHRQRTAYSLILPCWRALLAGPESLCDTKLPAPKVRGPRGCMAEAGLKRGKRGLIMGVANNRSIAWGIAKAARMQGADLAFTYQGDALKKRVEPLAEEVDGLVV